MENKLWLQQEWESDAAYAAFQWYLNPESGHTVRGAYRLYLQNRDPDKRFPRGDKAVHEKNTNGTWQQWSRGASAKGRAIPGSYSWEQRLQARNQWLAEQVDTDEVDKLLARQQQIEADEQADTEWLLDAWRESRDEVRVRAKETAFKMGKALEKQGKPAEAAVVRGIVDMRVIKEMAAAYKEITNIRRRNAKMPERITASDLTSGGKPFDAPQVILPARGNPVPLPDDEGEIE